MCKITSTFGLATMVIVSFKIDWKLSRFALGLSFVETSLRIKSSDLPTASARVRMIVWSGKKKQFLDCFFCVKTGNDVLNFL